MLRCDACSAPFSNGLTAACSHTPDTTICTAPRAQTSAMLFFLCLPLSLGNAGDQTAPAGRRADLQPEERRSIFPIRTTTNRDIKTQERDKDSECKEGGRIVSSHCLVVFGPSLDLCSCRMSLSSLSSFCGRWFVVLVFSLSDGFISQLFRFSSFWIFSRQVGIAVVANESLFVAAVFLCGHFVSFLLRHLLISCLSRLFYVSL